MQSGKTAIERLIRPSSVAIVGASPNEGHGRTALDNLVEGGYRGRIYPINPRYNNIRGIECYADLRDLPEVPDSAVIATGRVTAVDEVRKAAKLGVKGVVVCASGFAELGNQGRELQDEITRIAVAHELALLGPNTLGLVNVDANLWLFSGPVGGRPTAGGNVGVVAQSGSISLLLLMSEKLRLNQIYALGNQAVLTAADFVSELVEDAEIRVIGLFLEGIPNGRDFVEVLELARRRGKPVVICKAGRTDESVSAIAAHTAALAGSQEAFSALCRRHGVIEAEDLDELVDTLDLLSRLSRDIGSRMGVINCSGGENALILDLLSDEGLRCPPLSAHVAAEVAKHIPDFVTVKNPLDVTGSLVFNADRYRKALLEVSRDEVVDAILFVHDIPAAGGTGTYGRISRPVLDAVAEASISTDKPILFLSSLSGDLDNDGRRLLWRSGVPVLDGLSRGIHAIGNTCRWAEERARYDPRQHKRKDDIKGGGGRKSKSTSPVQQPDKEVLLHYGLPLAAERTCRTATEAVNAAAEIGFPVVLKVESPDISHRSGVGGVKAGVSSRNEVLKAYKEILENVNRQAPASTIVGVTVQEMVVGGSEFLLGMKRDETFGQLITLGFGGIFVEAIHRFIVRLAPITRMDAEEMVFELLGPNGAGEATVSQMLDVPALVDAMNRFSAFCADYSDVLEQVDLNPVMVLAQNGGIKVVDTLIR